MTVLEIIAQAEHISQETYSNSLWVIKLNMALQDLTPVAQMKEVISNKTLTVSANSAELTIANDTDLAKVFEFLQVFYTPSGGTEVELKKIPLDDFVSKGWKKTATKILFQGLGSENSGTARFIVHNRLTPIVYSAGPPESFTPSTPDLPIHAHYLLGLYMAAQAKKLEEETDSYAANWAEYNEGKRLFAAIQENISNA